VLNSTLPPFPDFSSASQATLKFLHNHLGFNLWMVTRTEGEDWIVLDAEDHGYGVKSGDCFRWLDSFCSEMVLGNGPCIAPNSKEIPAYANAPIGTQVPIGAYIGMPLSDADGGLFGTLCAIHPTAQDDRLKESLPLIELLGRMLSSLLVADLKNSVAERNRERQDLRELLDEATSAFNSNGLSQVLSAEEKRCAKFGHPAHVIHFQGNNIESMALAADVLRRCLPAAASIARPSENELVAVLPECKPETANEVIETLRVDLAHENMCGKIGIAARDPRSDLQSAVPKAASKAGPIRH
jgi:diguanylate cyclase